MFNKEVNKQAVQEECSQNVKTMSPSRNHLDNVFASDLRTNTQRHWNGAEDSVPWDPSNGYNTVKSTETSQSPSDKAGSVVVQRSMQGWGGGASCLVFLNCSNRNSPHYVSQELKPPQQ